MLADGRAANKINEVASRGLRLLVAVDFSAHSLTALRAARAMVRRSGGRLAIVHVRPPSDSRAAVLEDRGDLLGLGPARLAKALEEHYEKRLRGLRRRGETSESVRLVRGEVTREICREAGRGYEMLVMGTHGRGGAVSVLLGSTVQAALTRSPIPVLVVPARRKRQA